jgi:hypothetical protein
MVDYYIIANKGLVLKNMLLQETFKRVKCGRKKLIAVSRQLSGQRLKQLNELG